MQAFLNLFFKKGKSAFRKVDAEPFRQVDEYGGERSFHDPGPWWVRSMRPEACTWRFSLTDFSASVPGVTAMAGVSPVTAIRQMRLNRFMPRISTALGRSVCGFAKTRRSPIGTMNWFLAIGVSLFVLRRGSSLEPGIMKIDAENDMPKFRMNPPAGQGNWLGRKRFPVNCPWLSLSIPP